MTTSARRAAQKALYEQQIGMCYYCEHPLLSPYILYDLTKEYLLTLCDGQIGDFWSIYVIEHNISKKWIPTIEHRIPLAKKGNNRASNLVLACYECNHTKNNMSEEKFIKLLKENK